MSVISVKYADGGYNITVKRGALHELSKILNLDRRVLVVTDSGVPSQYADAVAAQCAHPVKVCIEQGEASKNFDSFKRLLSAMLAENFSRKDCVVAVGGGVVGDLCGFAASCYMRGIDFYNVPTTLLSQVDSSVGGKTAIDFEGVKNVVGTFYQPTEVVIDPDTLDTLSDRQLHAGLAEAVKMAATLDGALFKLIENCTDLRACLPDIIERSVAIKKYVVEQDPKEAGLRRVLNFGHTIGHAVESYCGGNYLHGECVAMGMLPMCGKDVKQRIEGMLEKFSLPTAIAQSKDELLPYMLHDKKMQGDKVAAVFCDKIGSYKMCEVAPGELFDFAEKNL